MTDQPSKPEGTTPPVPHVTALYRYPMKGMTPQPMTSVALKTGATIPFDRAWAIENGPGRFDPIAPRHLPKINFVMLMRDERLATLKADFSEDDQTLTIMRDGKQVARGDLTSKIGRTMLEQFIAAYMKDELRGPPKIVSASGHSFSDVAAKCLHIVNLASVRDLERVAGRTIDPLRFRANVYIDGVPAWSEFDWVGQTIKAGGVALNVLDRTVRCDATNVAPETGARDMAIPSLLLRAFGHSDFGIYAAVASDGTLSRADTLSTP